MSNKIIPSAAELVKYKKWLKAFKQVSGLEECLQQCMLVSISNIFIPTDEKINCCYTYNHFKDNDKAEYSTIMDSCACCGPHDIYERQLKSLTSNNIVNIEFKHHGTHDYSPDNDLETPRMILDNSFKGTYNVHSLKIYEIVRNSEVINHFCECIKKSKHLKTLELKFQYDWHARVILEAISENKSLEFVKLIVYEAEEEILKLVNKIKYSNFWTKIELFEDIELIETGNWEEIESENSSISK